MYLKSASSSICDDSPPPHFDAIGSGFQHNQQGSGYTIAPVPVHEVGVREGVGEEVYESQCAIASVKVEDEGDEESMEDEEALTPPPAYDEVIIEQDSAERKEQNILPQRSNRHTLRNQQASHFRDTARVLV